MVLDPVKLTIRTQPLKEGRKGCIRSGGQAPAFPVAVNWATSEVWALDCILKPCWNSRQVLEIRVAVGRESSHWGVSRISGGGKQDRLGKGSQMRREIPRTGMASQSYGALQLIH